MRTLPWKQALVVVALAGCGAAPPPRNTASSVAAIRSAEEMGAAQVPAASLHLQMAREQYEKAKKLVAEDEPTDAKYMLMRAEADAEVALALAREAQARQALAAVTPVQTQSPESSPTQTWPTQTLPGQPTEPDRTNPTPSDPGQNPMD